MLICVLKFSTQFLLLQIGLKSNKKYFSKRSQHEVALKSGRRWQVKEEIEDMSIMLLNSLGGGVEGGRKAKYIMF